MWALVPHYGAHFEDALLFADEYKAMTYWRGLSANDCVSVIQLYEDPDSGAWVFPSSQKRV